MGWNRGLGRRSSGRLDWRTDVEPKVPSANYVQKKERMETNAKAKRAKREADEIGG